MAYTTKALIGNKLERDLSTDEETLLDSALTAIDKYIDRETGTTFGSDVETDVYVSGEGNDTLVIPTMHEITTVEKVDWEDTVEETYTKYFKSPRGNTEIFALKKASDEWPEGDENIKITGKVGYEEVPKDIELAATLIGSQLIESRSDVSSESVGDWSVSYRNISEIAPRTALNILNSYKRLSRRI